MNEEVIAKVRSTYERTSGDLGANSTAIDKFIDMLEICCKSEDENVQKIAKNIEALKIIAPNFTIFESENMTSFMYAFRALSVNPNGDDIAFFHEFGHGILHATTETEVSDEFLDVVLRAKANALSEGVKEDFIDYVIYISDSENEKRTKWEKGPVGDIISSIFQYPSLTFVKRNNKQCVLPSFHTRDYYFDEEKGEIKVKPVFDEDFANFFALVANNRTKELEMLRFMFGDEWYQHMSDTLTKVATILEHHKNMDIDGVGDFGSMKV